MPQYEPVVRIRGNDGLGILKVGNKFYATDDQGVIPDVSNVVVQQLASPTSPISLALAGKFYGAEDGVLRGPDGKNLQIVGGTIRNEGAGWISYANTAHAAYGTTSVTSDSESITINYPIGANKIGTFLAGPDDTLAKAGVTVGASVSGSQAILTLGGNVKHSAYVEYTGTSWRCTGSANVSATWSNADGGRVQVSHPRLPVASSDQATDINMTRATASDAWISPSYPYSSVGFGVEFAAVDGTRYATPSTVMRFHFSHSSTGQLDPSKVTTTDFPGSNIWYFGIMETP